MQYKKTNIRSLSQAYALVQEHGCNCSEISLKTTSDSSSEDKNEMIINNLVNINNKSAEIVQTLNLAFEQEEEIDEWVSEKIAIANHMIGTINDYLIKYKTTSPATALTNTGLQLQPSTISANFPIKTNMPDVIASF